VTGLTPNPVERSYRGGAVKAIDPELFAPSSGLNTRVAACAEAGDLRQAAEWAGRALAVAPEEQRAELEQLQKSYESRATNPRQAARE
jgi:hypothetical protein